MTIDYGRMYYLINNVHLMSAKKPMFEEIEKAMTEVDPEGKELKGLYDFTIWINQRVSRTKFTVGKPQPVTNANTIGEKLLEIYNSGYKFEDCDDPTMLLDFCNPVNGNGELRPEQLSDRQGRAFRFIQKKYREWCETRGTVPRYTKTS